MADGANAAGLAGPLWPHRREWRRLAVLLGCGLVLRLALIGTLRTYDIPPKDDHYLYGHEYGRIARSLALGQGYANPYGFGQAGPTTKGCPLFPAYLSVLFRIFGIYSAGAAAAMHVTNSVASVLTALLAFVVGRRLFGAAAGWLAAGLYTFDPSSLWYSVNLIWESSLAALGMAALLVVFVWLARRPTVRAGIVSGLVAGVVAHVHLCALPVCATCGVWLLWWARGRRGAAVRALAAMAAACVVVIAPWSVRNSLIEGRLVVLRGNYMAFVAAAVAPDKEAYAHEEDPGFSAKAGHRAFDTLGQRGYSDRAAQQLRSGPRQGLGGYLRDVGIRSVRFWIGDVWRERDWYGSAHVRLPVPMRTLKVAAHALPAFLALVGFALVWRQGAAWLLVAQVAGFFPLYALVHCRLPRYRFPIHATLIVLAAVALQRPATALWRRVRGRQAVR